MMKAAIYTQFGGPITIQQVKIPSLDDSSCIVKVMATGVCRSDWHGWKGHDDDIQNHGLPFIPGHEFSGIVVSIGAHVSKIKVGDRVAVPFILSCGSCSECKLGKPTVCLDQNQPGFTMNGSFAEYVKITRADLNLCTIPKEVSFVEAAALGCRFTTAFRAVMQQGLQITDTNSQQFQHGRKPERTICVFGCGGLGLSCIMISKAYQHEENIKSIIGVDVSQKALVKAIELGADHVINSSGLTNDEVARQVMVLTQGLGCELCIDAAGFPSSCEQAVISTRRGCRMVQVGLPIGGRLPEINMGMVAGRELELVGSHGFSAKNLPDLLNLVKTGKLQVKKLVENEVTLEEGAKALMDMDSQSPLGMTIITKFQHCKM